MSLGARLKALRVANGQSLQDVADAVKASKAHIWDIERGESKNPTMDLLTRLAKHFKVPIATLVGENPAEETEEDLVVMYRDLKELSPGDRETINALVQHLQRKREKKGET